MKKLLAALLALMIISLSACSEEQTDEMEAEAIVIGKFTVAGKFGAA